MLFNALKKKKKAQSIVEFALVAPILVLVLLIIVEFGYALVIRNIVSDGTKEALMLVNNKFNNLTGDATAKKTSMETNIKASLVSYLTNHNVPNANSISVVVGTNANFVSTLSVSYQYKPYLLAVFVPGLSVIPLQSSQVINSAMLKENNFNSGYTSGDLASFSDQPIGALQYEEINGFNVRNNIAILVSWYEDYYIENVANAPLSARLFDWYGTDLLPPNLRVNVRRATLDVRSPYYNNGEWFNTNIPYVWVVAALGYTHVYFVKYNSTVDKQNGVGYQLNATNVGEHYWAADATLDWTNSSPLIWGQGEDTASWYPYLYRIYPYYFTQENESNHDNFTRSLGYRWCDRWGNPGAAGYCNSNLIGTDTIQELALKGISREGWPCISHGGSFWYNRLGNYEPILNTAANPMLNYYFFYFSLTPFITAILPNHLDRLQHYTVQTLSRNNFDKQYLINIWQPIIVDYYTSQDTPVSPFVLGWFGYPLYSAFSWYVNLNNSGVHEPYGGQQNTDIVDVYLDNDGDGIPNAWDDHPHLFDMDGNGILDGLQPNTNCDHHDHGQHHSDCHLNQVPLEIFAPDMTAFSPYVFPVPGMQDAYVVTTFDRYGTLSYTRKNDPMANNTYIPVPNLVYSSFVKSNNANSPELYVLCDGDNIPDWDGTMKDLCRYMPTWSTDATTRLQQKENFIHGHICGNEICLNQSEELSFLYNYFYNTGINVTTSYPQVWNN